MTGEIGIRRLAAIAALIFTSAAWAQTVQESREIDGKTYELRDGRWQLRAAGDRFYDVDPQVLTVKFRDDVPTADAQDLHAALGTTVVRQARTGFIDVRIGDGADLFAALDGYRNHPDVALAELNTFGRYASTPDDPTYGSQWHLPIIRADLAWDITAGLPSITVAVLDSGSNFSHPDFGLGSDAYESVWLNSGEDAWTTPDNPATGNGVDDDGNGFIDDWKGWDHFNNNNDSRGTNFHGTMVAGMAAAKTNNGLNVASVAGGFGGEGVKVMIGAVGDSFPSGAVLDDAILYALDNGAHVIQMSLTVGQAAAIDAALQMAADAGLFIVCASGNNNSTVMPFPASNSNVVSVGSTTQSEQRSGFSNYGDILDIAAPGSSVFSLGLTGTTSNSGTSFAAPIVSALAGLMLSHNAALTPAQIYQILIETAVKIGGYNYNWDPSRPGHSRELGYGRVDAFEAVKRAGVDLMLADSPADVGRQPNLESGDDIWTSVDIWNCVSDPGCAGHEPPVYMPGSDNYLRARVHNRGFVASSGGALHLHWTRARTAALWPNHWLDPADPRNPGTNTINGNPGGGEITVLPGTFTEDPIMIPALAPGESVTATRAWEPPDPGGLADGVTEPLLGLMARLVSAEDSLFNDADGLTLDFVADNNQVAVHVTGLTELTPGALTGTEISVAVHNVDVAAQTLDVRFAPLSANAGDYPGDITLILEQALWDLWQAGGSQSQGLTVQSPRVLTVDDPGAGGWLRNMAFGADTLYSLTVQFTAAPGVTVNMDGETFAYLLEQYRAGALDAEGATGFRVQLFQSYLQVLSSWPQITILELIRRLP